MSLVAEGTSFAVIDLETTGLFPATDRIVEVAVVKLAADGRVEETYCTLVNPGRDVGPTEVHGITATDVASAPRFDEIVGDLLPHLRGAVVVGHNLRFDLSFLAEEVARLGWVLPPVSSLCTLGLTRHLALDLPRRKLATCCEHAGIELTDQHSAAGDAAATARLLVHYLELGRVGGRRSLADFGAEVVDASAAWPACRPSGRVVLRGAAALTPTEDGLRVRRVLERLESAADSSAAAEAYGQVLDRVLEDRRVTAEEAERLYEVARIWSLTPEGARMVHRDYLRAIIDAALLDGRISPAEERDALRVTDLLGLSRQTFDEVRAEALASCRAAVLAAEQATMTMTHGLAGQSVCFTGSLGGVLDGRRLTRPMAEALVGALGLVVRERVTRDLDLLIVADPATQSTKANLARKYGSRILVESELWRALGVPVSLG